MTDFKDYWTVDEFLKKYRERLEEKELQLAECLAVKYGMKGFVETEDTKRERERCENELFEVKNKEWLVRYEYITEERTETATKCVEGSCDFITVHYPRQQRFMQVWEKASEIDRMSREGFPSYNGIEPTEVKVLLTIKKYSSEANPSEEGREE